MKSIRWQWLTAAAVAAATAGCGGNNIPEPLPVQNRVALESFSGANACKDLEAYIEDTAVLEMRTQLEAQKDNNYGGGWFGNYGGAPMADGTNAPMAAAGGAGGKEAAPAPQNYTTTNTQVAGVDEADFVKNDGTRIFVLSGDTLYANQSWPASALATAGTLKIEGWPREMFLDEQNHVVVFSTVWTEYPLDTYAMRGGMPYRGMYWGYYYANTVKVTVVDVSDLGHPVATNQFYLPGQYNNSRRVGSSVRLVISDSFRFPPAMQWYPEYSQGLYEDKARLAQAYDQLIADNTKLIRAQGLSDWLPNSKVTLADGTSVDIGIDCTQFHKTNAPTRLGLVTVATLNLSNPTEIKKTSIVGESGEIYASANSLYVANQHWWWWPAPGQKDTTYLHKFDISDPNDALYVASGKVDGHIVDQFSMDEDSHGYFRVATTIGTRVTDPTNSWGRVETTNRVSVLSEQSGALGVIGQTEDLATGERIYSSRFVGDNKAFVVTFRQVDPLFSIDMSDPANPHKVGELKVPGFSTYLHPIDENHLLTIGTFQPDCTTNPNGNCWQSRALQLAIFDVSDMANPQQTFVQLVGTTYGSSEAQYEHKAFNYFPAKGLLAIPFYDWSPNYLTGQSYWSSFTSELRVYSVDAATGITPKGAISMKDLYATYDYNGWYYYWQPNVRRSVMADDFVYAISDSGIKVANIADLGSTIAQVKFNMSSEQ